MRVCDSGGRRPAHLLADGREAEKGDVAVELDRAVEEAHVVVELDRRREGVLDPRELDFATALHDPANVVVGVIGPGPIYKDRSGLIVACLATVQFDVAEVGKPFRWGVLLNGPAGANVWGITTEIAFDCDEPPERSAQLIKMAEASCFTMASLRNPVECTLVATVNGAALNID